MKKEQQQMMWTLMLRLGQRKKKRFSRQTQWMRLVWTMERPVAQAQSVREHWPGQTREPVSKGQSGTSEDEASRQYFLEIFDRSVTIAEGAASFAAPEKSFTPHEGYA